MPQIPLYTAQGVLPTSTGLPRGASGVPVVPAALTGDPGASGLEQALAAPAEGLQGAGGAMVQAEALKLHRQRAFDVLNKETAHDEWQLAFQPRAAELRKENWQTYPERLEEEGKRLMEEHGTTLSPQARLMFEHKAKQTLSVFQQRALAERSAMTDQATLYRLSRNIQQAQEAMANAVTPYDREVAKGQFEDFTNELVATGLADGQRVADAQKKTYDAVKVQDVQNAIQRNPDAMVRQLDAQLAGTPTREDLPVAPVEQLATLRQQAGEVSNARFAQEEHRARYADYKRKQEQDRATIDLRANVYGTLPTPENVPTFQRLLTQAQQMMRNLEIDEKDGTALINDARQMMLTAQKPREVDNPEVERQARTLAQTAEAPQQFTAARQFLQSVMSPQHPQLKPETYSAIMDKIEQREKGAYWRNRPAVVAGKDVLMRGVLIPYGGSLAGMMKPEMQQKLQFAMDAYEQELSTLLNDPKQGTTALDRDAVDIAWKYRVQFLKPNPDSAQEYLPPEVQAVQTPYELSVVLARLRGEGWSDGTIKQLIVNWQAWRSYLGEQAGRRGTMGTGTQLQPRSYQLPGGVGPGTESRSK